jgi:hypothetical protein
MIRRRIDCYDLDRTLPDSQRARHGDKAKASLGLRCQYRASGSDDKLKRSGVAKLDEAKLLLEVAEQPAEAEGPLFEEPAKLSPGEELFGPPLNWAGSGVGADGRCGVVISREEVRVAASLQGAVQVGQAFTNLAVSSFGTRVMQAERSTSLIAPAVTRDSVAVAQDLVESLLYRDWALIMQHDGVGGGPAGTSVVVERCLRVGKDKHLANPETKLSCAPDFLN